MNEILLFVSSPLISASLILAVFYGVVFVLGQQSPMRSFFKSAPLSLLALHVFWLNGPLLLGLALVLSALGDAFLSYKGDRNFLAGLVSFLFAHLLYTGLFSSRFIGLENLDLATQIAFALFLFAGIAAATILWKLVGALLVPVLVYISVIVVMAWSGFASDFSFAVKMGILLFAISDFELSLETFVLEEGARKEAAKRTVWFTYYFGQFLIVAGILSGIVF